MSINTSLDCRELFSFLSIYDATIISGDPDAPYWNPLFLLSERDGNYITLPMYRIKDSVRMLLKNRNAPLAISVHLNNMCSYDFIKTSIGKTLFHYLVGYGPYNSLFKIKTKQDAVYYAGRGALFNDKLNPLIIVTLKLDTNTFNIKSGECRIDPVLFEENSLLSKTIIKDVLPFLPTIPAGTLYNSETSVLGDTEEVTLNWEDKQVYPKIVIEPLDKFIYKPKEGNWEEINNFLSNNLELITAQLK